MRHKYWLTIIPFFVLISCGQKNISDSFEKVNADTLSSETTKEETNSDNFNICYSSFPTGMTTESEYTVREKGYVGIFKGEKIFYEFWSYPNGNYLNVQYLFLRTDTIHIDNYDICLIELNPETPPDTLICKKFDKEQNEWIVDPKLTVDKIPTFRQALILGLNGWQRLSGLNGNLEDSPKIFITDEKLFLKYWDIDQENSWLIKQTYKYNGKNFTLASTDTLKTVLHSGQRE